MLNNVGLYLQDDGSFDLALENGDLKNDEGLDSLILVSLFSDKRIGVDEIPSGETGRRGWFGDDYGAQDGDKMGSKLWLLQRAKRTLETLKLTEDYCKDGLAWLVEDGIASSVTAVASFVGGVVEGRWTVTVTVARPNGNASRFLVLWDKQKIIRG